MLPQMRLHDTSKLLDSDDCLTVQWELTQVDGHVASKIINLNK